MPLIHERRGHPGKFLGAACPVGTCRAVGAAACRGVASRGEPWRAVTTCRGEPWRAVASRGEQWRAVTTCRGEPWRA
eukprot:2217943-Prymnesium_polylepis.1